MPNSVRDNLREAANKSLTFFDWQCLFENIRTEFQVFLWRQILYQFNLESIFGEEPGILYFFHQIIEKIKSSHLYSFSLTAANFVLTIFPCI